MAVLQGAELPFDLCCWYARLCGLVEVELNGQIYAHLLSKAMQHLNLLTVRAAIGIRTTRDSPRHGCLEID